MIDWFSRALGRRQFVASTSYEADPEVMHLLKAFARETKGKHRAYEAIDIERSRVGRSILEADEAAKAEIATVASLQLLSVPGGESQDWRKRTSLHELVTHLMQEQIAFTDEQLEVMADAMGDLSIEVWSIPGESMVQAFERHARECALTERMREGLGRLSHQLRRRTVSADTLRLANRIDELLTRPPTADIRTLPESEPWRATLETEVDDDPGWADLLAHCDTATTARPNDRWMRTADTLLEPIGVTEMGRVLVEVLDQVGRQWVEVDEDDGERLRTSLVAPETADRLRGLIWTAGLVADREVIEALGRAARMAYEKVPWHGPRSPKIGNACVNTLGRVGNDLAAKELIRLRATVEHDSARDTVKQTLRSVAERRGIRVATLEAGALGGGV